MPYFVKNLSDSLLNFGTEIWGGQNIFSKLVITLAKYNLQQTYYEHLNISNNISQLNENLKVLKQEKELQQKDLTKLSHQSNEKQLELLKVHLINYDIQEQHLLNKQEWA